MAVDTSLTLEQLEGPLGDLETAPTHLVRRCILASKIPLEKLQPEHLRLLIGQHISLSYVLPLALPLLEKNPLQSGDLYEGDILANLLTIDWSDARYKTHLPRVIAIAKAAHVAMVEEATEDLLQGMSLEQLGLSMDAFEKIRRRAIANISKAPWYELMNFLEIHG